ncbi:hypothetical protein AAG570_002065 [Ranatra chinensis]|uniref:Uncharacterized protein n=1 Tax=Ranatra chinensis TaxID=642074 RepID=A0ABD0YPA5_9HEMI
MASKRQNVFDKKIKQETERGSWNGALHVEPCHLARSALQFLDRYRIGGDTFLKSIVTGDETWVSHYTPLHKSMQWNHTDSPSGNKFKVVKPAKKMFSSVFWHRKGILLIVFYPSKGNNKLSSTGPRRLRKASTRRCVCMRPHVYTPVGYL